VLKVAFRRCGGVVLGWLGVALAVFVLVHDPLGDDAAPVVYLIERWRPGLALDEAKQQAAGEHLALDPIRRRGDYTVYLLRGRPEVSLGSCRGHLVSAWHSATVTTALQAFRYFGRMTGRPPEAAVSIQSIPDDSSPLWTLIVTWPMADSAVTTARLTADSGSVRLGVEHHVPDTECPTRPAQPNTVD